MSQVLCTLTSNATFVPQSFLYPASFHQIFSCYADVTNIVRNSGNGIYTLTGLNLTNYLSQNSQYCSLSFNYAGWSLLIVYEDSSLNPRQVNIYNGFKVLSNIGGLATSININLNNLDVSSTSNSKVGFLVWNSETINYTFPQFEENVKFNNNILSNPPLNSVGNIFNSTNSYTNSNTLWNMDLDYFDISPYISIGDTSANIIFESFDDRCAFQYIVTSIPNELPDATVEIATTNFNACQAGFLEVEFTVFNTNATDVLPSGTPVSLFLEDNTGNSVYITTVNTTQNIPIDGSETLTTIITVPTNTASPGELFVDVNRDTAGNQPIAENNKQNNTDSLIITLPEAPPNPSLDNISQCGTPNETEINLEEATTNIDKNLYTISFHGSQNAAENGQAEITSPNLYIPSSQTETIFVRVEDGSGCFSTGSFQVDLCRFHKLKIPRRWLPAKKTPPVVRQFSAFTKRFRNQ
ncbi:hypothetical protein [Mesonia maritima]|uniref:CARDB domain-containing protein n=1 Tax=Mesonia maritima TaxID=1793873 RepID=A0ABU1K4A5_9FLAO|nr:hypothetical protein [Mesonia maritima]MDR6300156.1 hypothetical protein [Mesonia maritima]